MVNMTLNEVIFIENLPKLDLHGYDRETARVATNDFVRENVKLRNDIIVIVHGIGEHIVKNAVHETLKKNKNVEEYKLHMFNIGCTIVKLLLDNSK